MKKFLLFLLLFITQQYFTSNQNPLLQAPQIISAEELSDLEKNWFTIFNWKRNFKCDITFAYHNQKAGFVIQCCKISLYWHNFDTIKNAMIEICSSQQYARQYYFAKPLTQQEVTNPQSINIDDLANFIETKKCIFYTGAGISACSVATMNGLMNDIEIQHGFWHFCKQAWKNPSNIAQAFESFCKSAIYTKPSVAHTALKNIALKQSINIMTENVDLLHQESGIKPLITAETKLHEITSDSIQELDMIICIGLSHDDRGFLQLFKNCNPHGKIIAIDLAQPDYLSNQDFLIKDDIQTILPELEQKLL